MPRHPFVFLLISFIIFSVGTLLGAILARRLPPPPRPRRLSDAQILARVAPPPAPAAPPPPPPPAPTLGVLVRDHLTDQKGTETLEWIAVGALIVAAAVVAISVEVGPGLADAAHRLRLSLP